MEQALDFVQELPREKLACDPWQSASRALWRALDFPLDARQLAAADIAFRTALAAEGWLDTVGPG